MNALPAREDIADALALVRRHFPVTRLLRSRLLSHPAPALWLKLESELPTGSFKVRGALYALQRAVRREGILEVTAASTGNHGAAVAFAAGLLGRDATVFLPEQPNATKRARIADAGATIVERGADITAARQAALSHAAASGAWLLDDATDPHVPAGCATIAVEVLHQLPDVRTLLVPVGDTALIRGVAAAVRLASADVRIIGVQAELAPAYTRAWQTGRAEPTDTCATIADGLATRVPDPANVAAIRQVVDDMCLVSDDEMLEAMRRLLDTDGIVSEPAGAAAVAAALQLAARDALPGPVVALVTGRNASARDGGSGV